MSTSWTGPTGGRSPREEAERLVAAALAAASVAARTTAGFATGAAECCVCPVCKAIAAMRDPSPEFAERLAAGAGDLATGLAAVLRAFGSASASGGGGDSDSASAGPIPDPPVQRQASDGGCDDDRYMDVDPGDGDAVADPWQAATPQVSHADHAIRRRTNARSEADREEGGSAAGAAGRRGRRRRGRSVTAGRY